MGKTSLLLFLLNVYFPIMFVKVTPFPPFVIRPQFAYVKTIKENGIKVRVNVVSVTKIRIKSL